jgi:hypothetical protein
MTALGFPSGATSPSEATAILLRDPERHLLLHLQGAPGRTGAARPTRAEVECYYETLDGTLAELIAAAGARETTWMLVSERAAADDAGIGQERLREFERRGEGGFFLAWGYGIRRAARPSTIDPVDLTPTVLYLAGYPIPNDMDGVVPFEILDDGYFFEQRLAFGR